MKVPYKLVHLLLIPFKGFKPKNGHPEVPKIRQKLMQLDAERNHKINELVEIAKQRYLLHKENKPNNPIREYVKTTHDDDLVLDLFLHFQEKERALLKRIVNSISHYANQNHYTIIMDDSLFNTSQNKQFWIPQSVLENGRLTEEEFSRIYLFWDILLASVKLKDSEDKKKLCKYATFTYLQQMRNKGYCEKIEHFLNHNIENPSQYGEKELTDLQKTVEELTIYFKESSVHKNCKHLIEKLRSGVKTKPREESVSNDQALKDTPAIESVSNDQPLLESIAIEPESIDPPLVESTAIEPERIDIALKAESNDQGLPECLAIVESGIYNQPLVAIESESNDNTLKAESKAKALKETTAKDILLHKLKNVEDIQIVKQLGAYTLEAMAVWVLGKHFNPFNLEYKRVSTQTLVKEFDMTVREHVMLESDPEFIKAKSRGSKYITKFLNKRKKKEKALDTPKRQPKDRKYLIGTLLFDYVVSKGILEKSNPGVQIKKKTKGKVTKYISPVTYVKCNFEVNDIPISVPLPMLCPPIPWGINPKEDSDFMKYVYPSLQSEYELHIQSLEKEKKTKPETDTLKGRSISNMIGGYLTGSRKGRMRRDVPLVTSHDHEQFDIHFHEHNMFGDDIALNLNRLQEQPFSINVNFLRYLRHRWSTLQKIGLVMPESLAHVKITDATKKLRELYRSKKFTDIADRYKLDDLINLFMKNIQKATFEQATMELAESLIGYKFYLPLFLDFRGRNYRRGVFHLHERDFMRSLFLFATPRTSYPIDKALKEDE